MELEQEMFYEDPRFWVAIAFVAFFVLFGKKIGKALGKALDGRAGRIRSELDEARRLREEAEALLASYKEKYAKVESEASNILSHARDEANTLVAQTQDELKQLLAARTRMAEEKIAQAEKQALDDVREHLADIALAAAHSLIAENVNRLNEDVPVQAAVQDLQQPGSKRKVH